MVISFLASVPVSFSCTSCSFIEYSVASRVLERDRFMGSQGPAGVTGPNVPGVGGSKQCNPAVIDAIVSSPSCSDAGVGTSTKS